MANALGIDRWGADLQPITKFVFFLLVIVIVIGIPSYKAYKEIDAMFSQPHQKNIFVIFAKIIFIFLLCFLLADLLISWGNKYLHLNFKW
jgi:hypothetical protein